MSRVVEVAVNTPAGQMDQTYSYRLSPCLEGIGIGWRVLVPFGRQKLDGVVVAEGQAMPDGRALREVLATLDDGPWFTSTMLKTAYWLHEQHCCSLAEALRLFIPGRSGVESERRYSLSAQGEEAVTQEPLLEELLQLAGRPHGVGLPEVVKRWGDAGLKALRKAVRLDWLESYAAVRQRGQRKVRQWVYLTVSSEQVQELLSSSTMKRRPAQRRLLEFLAQQGGAVAKAELAGQNLNGATLKGLLNDGCVAIKEEVVDRSRQDEAAGEKLLLPLTPEQTAARVAVEPCLAANKHGRFLLHGVTGSGKTQLYIELVRLVRKKGRQAIVLVPEIALTNQIVERFRAVFADDVTVIHSRMSLGERYDAYRNLMDEKCGIVIGPRSAVFAPCPDPGIIILDEEHEFTYKQEERPYYHARDVAMQRAQLEDAVVLLGSATPAIESYYRVATGEFTLLELRQRANALAMTPQIDIIDMRAELKAGRRSVVSQALHDLLQQTFTANEQAILLLNRRGHSTFVMCRECGAVMQCEQCAVSLVHHQVGADLRCHYCHSRYPIPQVCPKCGSHYIRYFGTGTQKLEEEIAARFPGLRVARMDQDTVKSKGAHGRILKAFRDGEYDLLLGTQMVAKGHDIGNVTAVGILAIDSVLNLPDFRASERAYSLIVQAAGRAGRAEKPGRVVVQTYNPEHYVFQAAVEQNFAAFCQQELHFRKLLNYPPYTVMAKVAAAGEDGAMVWKAISAVAATLKRERRPGIEVSDPYLPGVAKIQGRHRAQLLLKGPSRQALVELLRHCGMADRADLTIDLEPLSL